MADLWDTNTDNQYNNDYTGATGNNDFADVYNSNTVQLNEAETAAENQRYAARENEEADRRAALRAKIDKEVTDKNELRLAANTYLEEKRQQRKDRIEKNRRQNKENEAELLNQRVQKDENPWKRVVDNIAVKSSEYRGSKEVGTMRNVIMARKGDFTNMKLK